MGEEAKILENEAQACSGIGEGKRAPIQRFQAHQAPKKRGFPGAGGTQQTKMLAPGKGYGQIAKEFIGPKGLSRPRKAEHDGAHEGRPRRRSRRRTIATRGNRISKYSPAAAMRGVGFASRA